MALRILSKLKIKDIQQVSRTLSSAAFIRDHVKPNGYSGINNRLLDVPLKVSGLRHSYDKKKGSSKSSRADLDEDDDIEEFADDIDKNRITKVRVQSLRCDLLIKSALSIGRNKIEQSFYEGKIRLNGKKITKKSAHCDSGDVIEIIKGDSITNPDEHLSVARIEILDVKTDGEEFIYVTMKKFKNLTVSKEDMK